MASNLLLTSLLFLQTVAINTNRTVDFRRAAGVSVSSSSGGLSYRISDGNPTEPIGFRHQAAIVRFHNAWDVTFCGGSLIAAEWVLSAASCLQACEAQGNATQPCSKFFRIILGATFLQSEEPTQEHHLAQFVTPHPDFSGTAHDIALIKLSRPATLSEYIQLVSLPSDDLVGKDLRGTDIYLSGWGQTEYGGRIPSSMLQVGRLTAWIPLLCRLYNLHNAAVDNLLCTLGDSPCEGDFGGGLVIPTPRQEAMWTQVAVTSTSTGKCGRNVYFPAVHTRIDNYLPWIRRQVGIPSI